MLQDRDPVADSGERILSRAQDVENFLVTDSVRREVESEVLGPRYGINEVEENIHRVFLV